MGNPTRCAIVIILDRAVGQALDRWRRIYHPDGARRLPPHITLIPPFNCDIPFPTLEEHLTQVCSAQRPFGLELMGIYPARRVGMVFLRTAFGTDKVLDLHRAVCAGPLARFAFELRPHVTLARTNDEEDLERAYADLNERRLHFVTMISEVALMQKGRGGVWDTLRNFPLGGKG